MYRRPEFLNGAALQHDAMTRLEAFEPNFAPKTNLPRQLRLYPPQSDRNLICLNSSDHSKAVLGMTWLRTPQLIPRHISSGGANYEQKTSKPSRAMMSWQTTAELYLKPSGSLRHHLFRRTICREVYVIFLATECRAKTLAALNFARHDRHLVELNLDPNVAHSF